MRRLGLDVPASRNLQRRDARGGRARVGLLTVVLLFGATAAMLASAVPALATAGYSVVAAGNNKSAVLDWTNMVQVCSGAYQTVGLTADGHVVAVGDNTYGQCNVNGSDWTDMSIMQVAAGWATTASCCLVPSPDRYRR